ncbi:MAG: hypothetical protein LBF00_01230 [Mycoplasmataceae bacterium]|jgi:hypothetical protein|nr:hypothetical protein [Mycoplasmataceae bacterium]
MLNIKKLKGEVSKVSGKKPKYATIGYVDSKFNELNDKINLMLKHLKIG